MSRPPLHLVATSDVHIGTYDTATDEHGENMGLVSNRRCRQALLDYCALQKPDYGLFAGDLYRSAIGRPTQAEQWEASGFFRDWSLICPLILKPGNHDVDRLRNGVHALQIFDAMNLRLKVLPVDGWSVIDLEGIKVGMYHGMLAGVTLESGLRSDSVVSNLPELKDAPEADLYVLGDVHHRQFVGKDAAYCGALDRLNFGEEDEVPSFWDIRIDRDTKEVTWKAVTTPARKYLTIVDEDYIDGNPDIRGAVVRFVGELRKLHESDIKAKLRAAGALEVQSIVDLSEYSEAGSMFTGMKPEEAFAVWLDAQENVTKADKQYAQAVLVELLG